jgi:nucleoside-diphosphate-sugar epimerase
MQVFVAGASGAVGRPLIAQLIHQGHTVAGMTSSDAGVQLLERLGATPVQVNALDRDAMASTLRRLEPEVVIDELTSLPKDPAKLLAASPADRKLRIEGGGNLHRAAQACGVRHYVQQGCGFFLKAGAGLADESEPLANGCQPRRYRVRADVLRD